MGRLSRAHEDYYAIPEGWDVDSVLATHASMGGRYVLEPLRIPRDFDAWFKYRAVLYNVADGVRAQDAACVELAIRFIELPFVGSYTGFVRALLARRLKHVVLSEQQRRRLHQRFAHLVESGQRSHEFKQYLRLWRQIITHEEKDGLMSRVRQQHGEAAAMWLSSAIDPPGGAVPSAMAFGLGRQGA